MARRALLWKLALLMIEAAGMQAAGPPHGDIDSNCFLQLPVGNVSRNASSAAEVRTHVAENLAGLGVALSRAEMQLLASVAGLPIPNTTGVVAAAVPSNTSSGKNPGPVYDLLVIIPVAAGERSRRDAIRKSWMRYMRSPCCESCSRHSVHTIFIVGNEGNVTDSRAEARETGDLHVLDDLGQGEHSTMAMSERTAFSIRYAVRHFNFRFLLKADSDSWVFYDRLLSKFDETQLWRRERLYAGNFRASFGMMPNEDPNSERYDPVYRQMAPARPLYPKHAQGAGYVLSRRLAEYVATVRPETHEFLPLEDVAVGFWLSTLKKRFYELSVALHDECGSAAAGPVIDHHVIPLEKMQERWSSYELTGDPCMSASALSSFNGSRAKPKCAATL